MNERFCPERLKLARLRNRLTKVELARRAGLSARRLAAFENEDAAPPTDTINGLARLLGYPVAFFYKECVGTVVAESVSFRSFTKMAARDRDAALAAAALAAELSAWLAHTFTLPDVQLPDFRGVEPEVAATALRSEWSLGEGPAPNLVHLLEVKGVRVFSLVHDCAALDALSAWVDEKPFVFLGRTKSAERSRWDAAHELGHLALHHEQPPTTREHEADADAFAAEFLMPKAGFKPSVPRIVSLQEVRAHKVVWRVSAVAWIRRAFGLGLLTDWAYRMLIVEASQAGLRSRENDIDREESRLFPMVLDLLAEDGTSVADIAVELSIPVHEIRDLLFLPSMHTPPRLRLVQADSREDSLLRLPLSAPSK